MVGTAAGRARAPFWSVPATRKRTGGGKVRTAGRAWWPLPRPIKPRRRIGALVASRSRRCPLSTSSIRCSLSTFRCPLAVHYSLSAVRCPLFVFYTSSFQLLCIIGNAPIRGLIIEAIRRGGGGCLLAQMVTAAFRGHGTLVDVFSERRGRLRGGLRAGGGGHRRRWPTVKATRP